VRNIGSIIMMGGSSGEGPPLVGEVGDFNFEIAPKAVNVLLSLDVPKTVIPPQVAVSRSL
jgi:inosine-uridine nucleoside N-ribohydrolase